MRLCCPKCCEGYSEDLSHCPKCGPINVGKTAAGAWCYDVDAAPRDIDLLTVSAEGNLVVAQRWTPDENGNEWYGDACRFTPSAWAAINLPEIGQT